MEKKVYKHKRLGWTASELKDCYYLNHNCKFVFDYIPKVVVEDSADWELIEPKDSGNWKREPDYASLKVINSELELKNAELKKENEKLNKIMIDFCTQTALM